MQKYREKYTKNSSEQTVKVIYTFKNTDKKRSNRFTVCSIESFRIKKRLEAAIAVRYHSTLTVLHLTGRMSKNETPCNT